MFCQQHNADAFNECDSSGLISWTLCIKAESLFFINLLDYWFIQDTRSFYNTQKIGRIWNFE